MEMDLEPRVKPLPYKVKAMSRESPSQKAGQVLETDLRSHWSTGTNTKEWILLELEEPCLLSHIRIYNKSVLEWEITVGLQYKPESFVKVRPRCEAPRRDMVYPVNYTPCRYVRISCLRGNPIAIFFIQLIGISIPGLEPEFQPVVNHLLPHIISHKLDAHDMHLQFLQDMTRRLRTFLPQLEADLCGFPDDVDSNLRFLAMLTGPFYPILQVINERETGRSAASVVTVSSNFEPRRSRGTSFVALSASNSAVFRSDAILMLLRKACKDPDLRIVCRMAAKILQKLSVSVVQEDPTCTGVASTSEEDASKSEICSPDDKADYASLFGEKITMLVSDFDSSIINILDIAAVEEGILHVLFSCAAQPVLCSRLSEKPSNLWSALPLVQALLPALRPHGSSSSDNITDFSLWGQAYVQQALSQIVLMSSSPSYRSLLQACAGYLSSFSQSHAKAACILIDLCSSILAPWAAQVIAKVDLSVELLEDLLGTIQGARQSMASARAALKYIVLALSGYIDNILGKYKEVKHRILFLVEMLEPFLDPAMRPLKSGITFGDTMITKKQEENCMIALNVIHVAVEKPAVLPSLETQWRNGSVSPSVLLSILDPQLELPPGIDLCKSNSSRSTDIESSSVSKVLLRQVGPPKSPKQTDSDISSEISESVTKIDIYDDVRFYFAPQELRGLTLTSTNRSCNEAIGDLRPEQKGDKKFNFLFPSGLVLDTGFGSKYFNLQADYIQLENIRDCELKASEFKLLAQKLHSLDSVSVEDHDASVDALLLAAECYVNPFFVKSFEVSSKIINEIELSKTRNQKEIDFRRITKTRNIDMETIGQLERQRDVAVFQILLEAAKLDANFKNYLSKEEMHNCTEESDEPVVVLSPNDMLSQDAVTLVRQNQAILCNFLVQRLLKDRQSQHEILMHCLVFLLHSAIKLSCPPEDVIDIILRSAEYLDGMLSSIHNQLKNGNCQLKPEKILVIQRRYLLLQRLVIASSGSGCDSDSAADVDNGFLHGSLIPPSSWMQKIPTFAYSSSPAVRFLGWMAVSRVAKQFINDRLYLVSDLSDLTCILSIFADELAVVDKFIDVKFGDTKMETFLCQKESLASEASERSDNRSGYQSLQVLYPYLGLFFPQMKKQFESFGEVILEAVSLQLRLLSSAALPDILCWFSDLCSWPFFDEDQYSGKNPDFFKGYVAKNAKAIVIFILEAIVKGHMEALVPEIPRVVQVSVSLCRASYCDVAFLNSVLIVLRPIISYSLQKALAEEKLPSDDGSLDFESLCFEELFKSMRQRDDSQSTCIRKASTRSRMIFVLAFVLPDLSFQSRSAFLQSLVLWTDFPVFEPTSSFHDYLCAFQAVLDSCKVFLLQVLQAFGCLSLQLSDVSSSQMFSESKACKEPRFLKDILQNSSCVSHSPRISTSSVSNRQSYKLSTEAVEEFTKDLEGFIVCLQMTIEKCWSLHHQLSKKLSVTSAECFVCLRCLVSVLPTIQNSEVDNGENPDIDHLLIHWNKGLEGLAEMVLDLQEKCCWEVASTTVDCLLEAPPCFELESIIDFVCSAIRKNAFSAPKLVLRLQSEKWLSLLVGRVAHGLCESDVAPLVDLFCTMLGHPEPEQRLIGLQHLAKLVGKDADDGVVMQPSMVFDKPLGTVSSAPEPIFSLLVASTWDSVVVRASSDTSMPIRARALALLVDFIPFANQKLVQTFLGVADNVLYGFGKGSQPVGEGPLLRLSLALIASCCLYCSAEDLALVPQNIWKRIEILGSSKTDGRLGDVEKKACQLLCRLRDGDEGAKEALKVVVSSSSEEKCDPDFESTRQSVLEVLSSLSSAQLFFELFARKADEEAIALEEAEMELNIVQKEFGVLDPSPFNEEHQLPHVATSLEIDNRLQQIKDDIYAMEKAKLREDIVARRQKKILMMRERQKYLEEAALQETERLRELDRERAAEAEKEIERQHALELERAKTRELRNQLEMEKEKQAQRELQRELEQAESGLRSSRRDFSTSHSGRARERYRERDNGRSGSEGGTRTGTGSFQQEAGSSMVNTPTVVLSGSRSFSGQPPTILQSRDRLDECGSSYDETVEGSRDSGDTGSVGEVEMGHGFEGQPGNFVLGQRLGGGSRGGKPRQVMDRRERGEGRREGKWERKH
ncbi:PREDICTED: uncharacterized protein LOC104805731 isoform X2 [Tarenaya hassleriana]|uniref:uncharacterized protein LOC104805731 isoform X2 n=1 Tax=Tarenaya hassleriana TaxID=28532 RepID=UPI00053C5EA3|nr:PREDICTED: uncharacterized protein LOC104805731 isoform X2 [Tarenaya hassleriana]